MKLARYWAKESRNSNTGQGQEYELACWRGSNESEADAQARAVEAVERLVARVKQGEPLERYDYSEGYIREELIEEINSAEGELIGVVTRNRYGALVLNCERVLFADIDIEPPGLIDKLKALFGGRVKDRNYHLQQIESYASEQPGIALAVYETLAGLRVVVTNRLYGAKDLGTEQLFDRLECDPLYIKLCRTQESFRARLTPKPWRIDYSRPPNNFPRESSEARQRFNGWLKGYEQQSGSYQVCRFLKRFGDQRPLAEVERVLKIHDRYVLSPKELPLA
ncbi:hypothetical protein BOW53_08075 [Solemya pervernicosa gill symbiont]|uniref:Uncharacterized protein n=1 Tax=Solemya pervernicosa gill symbiont TaxID=642797 RepID=A0A1T2L5H6_9GAMM|nr:hypothetical protein [Solemya pervernicosa gill symbiont]OOZ40321.1 hypothetical protein BOW53_08075 [Solemya pervernicosa gill symbiont]